MCINLLNELSECLYEIVKEIEPEYIVGPLATGLHVDHRLVNKLLIDFPHKKKLFYEDKPYAIAQEHKFISLYKEFIFTEASWNKYFSVGYISKFCSSKREQEKVKEIIVKKQDRDYFEKRNFNLFSSLLFDIATVDRAISCYQSQINNLFPDFEEYRLFYSKPENLWMLKASL